MMFTGTIQSVRLLFCVNLGEFVFQIFYLDNTSNKHRPHMEAASSEDMLTSISHQTGHCIYYQPVLSTIPKSSISLGSTKYLGENFVSGIGGCRNITRRVLHPSEHCGTGTALTNRHTGVVVGFYPLSGKEHRRLEPDSRWLWGLLSSESDLSEERFRGA
jgi:hypothetical protein